MRDLTGSEVRDLLDVAGAESVDELIVQLTAWRRGQVGSRLAAHDHTASRDD